MRVPSGEGTNSQYRLTMNPLVIGTLMLNTMMRALSFAVDFIGDRGQHPTLPTLGRSKRKPQLYKGWGGAMDAVLTRHASCPTPITSSSRGPLRMTSEQARRECLSLEEKPDNF